MPSEYERGAEAMSRDQRIEYAWEALDAAIDESDAGEWGWLTDLRDKMDWALALPTPPPAKPTEPMMPAGCVKCGCAVTTIPHTVYALCRRCDDDDTPIAKPDAAAEAREAFEASMRGRYAEQGVVLRFKRTTTGAYRLDLLERKWSIWREAWDAAEAWRQAEQAERAEEGGSDE